ncbi:MAG: winged helix-turn-helix domain-containing protein [Candidatus Jordarchaeum sp.]|uniref:winged helix-turn-helix domain-containing protein n=1 Tax=Candidatus Jordarchaeum sp. TaxID=2823881 RepID=UPI00404AC61E
MSNTEKRIAEIGQKLIEINKNITNLQDLILYMKTTLETVTRREIEKECLAKLTLKTNENMDKFLRERDPECSIMDWCTRRVEKASSMVLRAFMEQGTRSAIEQVRYHVDAATRHCKEIKCPNEECFRNAISNFKTLEELLENTQEVSAKFTKELYSPKSWSGFEEIKEEEICDLLAPLSNVTRLKILISLGKGGKNFSQLERQIGIKGGHLQFHLNSLIQAGYVAQEKPQGKYLITIKGLRALRFSYELRDIIGENQSSQTKLGII